MSSYNANIPSATDIPAQSQPLLKLNAQYLQAFASVDHNFTGNSVSAGDGFHDKVTFNANIAAPGFGAGVSALFPALVNGLSSAWMQNAGGSFAVTGTNPIVAAKGSTCLPGGLLLQWGTETSNIAFTWAIPFTTFYACQITILSAFANRNVTRFSAGPGNAGATVQVLSTVTGNVDATATFFYMAIGAKP